jgi:hypothetical protein
MTISPSMAVRILHPNSCAPPQFGHMRTHVQPTEESIVSETQPDFLSAPATPGFLASINSRQSPLSIPGAFFFLPSVIFILLVVIAELHVCFIQVLLFLQVHMHFFFRIVLL